MPKDVRFVSQNGQWVSQNGQYVSQKWPKGFPKWPICVQNDKYLYPRITFYSMDNPFKLFITNLSKFKDAICDFFLTAVLFMQKLQF